VQVSSEKRKKKVLLIAGEASGDNYGSRVIRELKSLSPGKELWAVGGDNMEREGARLISHYSAISVVGLVEVLGRLSPITALLKEIKRVIKRGEVQCIVLIDFPDFNFIVGKYAKRYNIPVIYYIPPQMWAWREGRAKVLKDISTHIVVPFPFEVDFFKTHSVAVHYYGHPLLEILEDEGVTIDSRDFKGIRGGGRLRVGLFPGSREAEVARMLPLQMGAAKILHDRYGDVDFFLPLANSSLRSTIEKIVGNFQHRVNILGKRNYEIFNEIDLAIASSGTVTLELAIFGVPTVIIYKVSPLTYIIGKMVVKIDRIGLPNIITGEKMFPEFVQNAATPANIAGGIDGFLNDAGSVDKVKEKSKELMQNLRGDGPSKKVAELVLQELT
jgi:lipid-A-disaccharide synthase